MAVFIHKTPWAFTTIEVVHVFAVSIALGTIALVDLRLLGLASTKRPFAEFSRQILPFTWVAFVVGVIAGSLARARRKPTESLDAYDYFLRGIASPYRWTRKGNDEALTLFYKAIELDPDFATAHGMAAWCYVLRQLNGWTTDRPNEVAEIMRLAERVTESGKTMPSRSRSAGLRSAALSRTSKVVSV